MIQVVIWTHGKVYFFTFMMFQFDVSNVLFHKRSLKIVGDIKHLAKKLNHVLVAKLPWHQVLPAHLLKVEARKQVVEADKQGAPWHFLMLVFCFFVIFIMLL